MWTSFFSARHIFICLCSLRVRRSLRITWDFPGDRASLLAGMEESAVKFPKKEFEAVRALEEGDLVAVHGRVRLTPSSPWIALIHIFRFEGNQIIEEWEAGQEVPKDSPNKNGVF